MEPCNKRWCQCQLDIIFCSFEFKDQWCNFSCNLASERRRLKPFNMQDACMTSWGVLLPQGENAPVAALNQYNYTGSTVERETWSHGMTSVVICGNTLLGVSYYIFGPLAFVSHTWLPCWLCTWMFHLFSLFVANVCTRILNSWTENAMPSCS